MKPPDRLLLADSPWPCVGGDHGRRGVSTTRGPTRGRMRQSFKLPVDDPGDV